MSFSKREMLCRVCLDKTKSSLISIFDHGFREIFERCTSLSVSEDDIYPKFLCSLCCDILQMFSQFTEKSLQSARDWEAELSREKQNYEGDEGRKFLDIDVDGETIYKSGTISQQEQNKYEFRGICNVCKESFYNFVNSSKKHVCRGNNNTNTENLSLDFLLCGICRETFKSLDKLNTHLEQHRVSGVLACRLCQHTAVDFADLLAHRYSHCPPDKKYKIVCCECNHKSFRLADRLEFHYREVHMGATPGICKKCDKTYTNYRQFKEHVIVHTDTRFPCEVCKKTFRYKKSLEGHSRLHTKGLTQMCQYCGVCFRRDRNLKEHVFNVHTKHVPRPCAVCGKVFKNETTLDSHKRRIHGTRDFSCPVCEKSFYKQYDLKSHMLWHSESRPYRCEICEAAFKSKSSLGHHVKTIHMGIRPFSCVECDKRHYSKANLKRHIMRVHKRKKPFSCDACGAMFAEKNKLNCHLQKHTSEVASRKRDIKC